MLNYNMQGMTKSLSELFAMLKTAEVEIKKEHVVLMVNKTTDFKKSDKKTRARGESPRGMASLLPILARHPRQSPGSRASTARAKATGSVTTPST